MAKNDQAGKAFVEESRLEPSPLFVDEHGVREPLQFRVGDEIAVCFLIGEIPPPADALCEDHPGKKAVCHAEKVDLVYDTEKHHPDRAADDAAIDRKTARAEMDPLAHVSVKGAIIRTRPDDADRQNTDQQIQRPVDGNIASFEKERDDDRGENDAAHDDDGIIIDRKPENRDSRIQQAGHIHVFAPSDRRPSRIARTGGSVNNLKMSLLYHTAPKN